MILIYLELLIRITITYHYASFSSVSPIEYHFSQMIHTITKYSDFIWLQIVKTLSLIYWHSSDLFSIHLLSSKYHVIIGFPEMHRKHDRMLSLTEPRDQGNTQDGGANDKWWRCQTSSSPSPTLAIMLPLIPFISYCDWFTFTEWFIDLLKILHLSVWRCLF